MSRASQREPAIRWERCFAEPFLAPLAGSPAPAAVTTPDFLQFNGQAMLLIGAVEAGRERILRLPLPQVDFSSPLTSRLPGAAVVLDAGPQAFDNQHVFDPGALVWNGRIYLYYSAIGEGADRIGLAVSDDGEHFVKHSHPLFEGRAPDAILRQEKLYLFYVLQDGGNGYRIFASVSSDGVNFSAVSNRPLLEAGGPAAWDSFEVTTPRLFEHGGVYYMLYAGSHSPQRRDLPEGFGLARSADLLTWEKYPSNPVFCLGDEGAWDAGAVWFGTVFERQGWLYLMYEGGRMADILGRSPALTQVGLARLSCAEFEAGW